MKRLLTGATVFALLASPAAIAQPQGRSAPPHVESQRQGDREWQPQGRADGSQQAGGHVQHQDAIEHRDTDRHRDNVQHRDYAEHRDNGQHRDWGQHRGWGRDRGNNARWGRGQQMGYNDWRNARQVDYRRHNLRQPPRGYEWRRTNDRYVMAAVATGMIISVILVRAR